MAVSFFFVLGGFSMTLGYKDRILSHEFNYRKYLVRRCIKFYPLHWLCLLIAVPFTIAIFKWTHVPVFVANACLAHTLLPFEKLNFSYNAVSWYLANTMFFSLVFPFVLRTILKASVLKKSVIAIICAMGYITIALMLPEEFYHTVLYVSPYIRLADFVLGIYLALAFLVLKENHRLYYSPVIGMILLSLCIILLVVESIVLADNTRYISPVYWPLVSLIILVAAVTGNKTGGGYILLESRLFVRLGELSFVIFMTHQLVLRYISLVFEQFNYSNIFLYIAVGIVLTVLVSILIEKYILKPITQWLTKRIQPSMTARS